jgi:hypothetical protein
MDWDLAIKRNSKALKGIIEVLDTGPSHHSEVQLNFSCTA